MIPDPSTRTTQRAAYRFSPALTAAAVGVLLAVAGALFPSPSTWMQSWRGLLDLCASLWIAGFTLALPACWLIQAFVGRRTGHASAGAASDEPTAAPGRRHAWWPAVLLALCAAELLAHADDRNGFLATSRPTSGIETWTNADGYATLLDGHLAQGDGLFLLPMLNLFLGDGPPAQSEFDRRAGHVYLVSLLARPLGEYWSFGAVNLLSWWVAALSVWWLGRRRWPGGSVPLVASVLTATGQGFVFMAAAPQAHAVAYGAFAGLLALADRLGAWRRTAGLGTWLRLGWAAGAAGLIYLVHVPALAMLWLYGVGRARVLGMAAASAVALAIVAAWQAYGGALLGLTFAGGNNDLAGEALQGWLRLAAQGPTRLVEQLHNGSFRGLLVAAFYYPWWVLAILGAAWSPRESRRWALAVILAAALPAFAFTTRFHLPRLAYFMYPAVYLLAAQGIDRLAGRGRRTWLVVALTLPLIVLTNVDLAGLQQLNLWFHYSQGNSW